MKPSTEVKHLISMVICSNKLSFVIQIILCLHRVDHLSTVFDDGLTEAKPKSPIIPEGKKAELVIKGNMVKYLIFFCREKNL